MIRKRMLHKALQGWVAVVIPTYRPKSVRKPYVIESFGGLFVLLFRFYEFSVGVGAFLWDQKTESWVVMSPDFFPFLFGTTTIK